MNLVFILGGPQFLPIDDDRFFIIFAYKGGGVIPLALFICITLSVTAFAKIEQLIIFILNAIIRSFNF